VDLGIDSAAINNNNIFDIKISLDVYIRISFYKSFSFQFFLYVGKLLRLLDFLDHAKV
jgi:hypothetical protein